MTTKIPVELSSTPGIVDGSNATAITIDSSENVLVGTTNTLPANNNVEGIALSAGSYGGRLEASRSGGAPCSFNRVDTDGSIIEIRRAGTSIGTIGVGNSNDLTIGTADTGLVFQDNERISPWNPSTNALRDGAIDLGDSDRRFKDLYLSGIANVGTYVRFGGASNYYVHSDNANYLRFGTAGSERMRINSSGNLLVGGTVEAGGAQSGISINAADTASNIYVRHANGTSTGSRYMAFTYNTSELGSITQHGTSQVLFNVSSDARLKDVTGEARGLEVINALNPVSFDWKADGQADEGLIAQEVEKIVPNAVSQTEDEYYQMDYSKLVTNLIAGMKEQQEQIEQLKTEIQTLKGE